MEEIPLENNYDIIAENLGNLPNKRIASKIKPKAGLGGLDKIGKPGRRSQSL